MANNLTRIKNNQVTDRTLTNVKIATSTLTGDLFNPEITLNSNVTISGNLTVTGGVTSVQSTSTQITDPLITLGVGNSGTSYDEGFIFTRGGTGNFFLGYKENLDELVFINTTETGSTTGNIATNSYGNARIGNLVTLGTGVVGLVSMSAGTVTTTSGNLTLTSTAGNVNVTGGMTISGNIYAPNMIMQGDIQSGSINNTVIGNVTPASGVFTTLGATSTMSVAGTATVNALVSNGAISGTTGTYTGALSTTSTLSSSGTATVNALVSNTTIAGTQATLTGGLVLNTNATVNTNQTTASLFNTTATTLNIGGAATTIEIGAATGTTNVNNNLIVSGAFTSSSTATVNSLVSNGAISGTTLALSSTLNASGTATVNALVSNGAISGTTGTFSGNVGTANLAVTGLATVSSTLSVAGTATVNALVSNGAISGTTGTYTGALTTTSTLNSSGTATVNSLVSNGAISGTTGTFTTSVTTPTLNAATIGNTGATVVGATVSAATIGNTGAVFAGASGTLTGTFNAATLQAATIGNTGAAHIGSTLALSSTLTASGTATVNALVSNGAISGTTGTFSGNVSAGNLHVNGTLTYINSTTMEIVDPIIELNTLANGAALTSDNNYDSGIRTHYYSGSDKSAFFGRVDSSGYLEYFSDVTSETTGVIAGTYGTIKSGGLVVTGAGSFGSTLTTSGTATVNSLVSNGAISGTTGTFTTSVTTPTLNAATIGNTGAVIIGATVNAATIGNTGSALTGATGAFATSVTTATVNAATIGNTGAAFTGATLTTTGNIYTSAGNVYVPAGNVTASGGYYTGNVTILGNLIASIEVVGNTGTFYGDSTTGEGALYAGVPTGYTLLPNVVAQFTTNVNNYSQINAQNINSGTYASTDIVATADNGDDESFYINMGINSSTFANPTYGAYGPNDGYLIADGGNLLLNAEATGKEIKFVVGDYSTVVGQISSTRFAVNAATASTNKTNGALVVSGGVGVGGAINGGSTLNIVGTATVNALVSNGAISGTTGTYTGALTTTSTLTASGTATVNALVSNGAISGTTGTYTGALTTTSTLTASGTATVNALVSNGAISGTTGTFSSALTANGAVNFNATTASTSYTTGAVIVDGGVGVAGNLNVSGTSYANLANIQISGNTVSSITTNGNININPNGTGQVVINSDQDNSKFVVKGTTANANVGSLFVVSTSTDQIGVRQETFVDGAALQVNSTDSILLPVGAQGDRPSSPVAGMFRFSTTAGAVEWYDGSGWGTASTQFTIVQANTATGDGSTTNFTLPIGNASTAGTIVSINGIVQKPVDAYGITGSTLAFTEAPAAGDVIDIRAFTTTVTVTSLVDSVGTTGLFLDDASVDDKIIVFKNSGTNTVSIDANGYVEMKSNGFIISTPSVTAAATATTIDTFATSSYRAAKYLVTARNSGSTQWTTMEALVVHDGTAATITTYGIVNTGATTQITLSATISGGNVLVQATGAAAGTVVNFEKTYIVGS